MAILLIYGELDSGREVKFDKNRITIGRRQENDVMLSDMFVSRTHATITKSGDDYVLEDNHSTYGTFVNGKKVTRRALRYGDEIRVGNTIVAFIDEKMVDKVKITPPAKFLGDTIDVRAELDKLKTVINEGVDGKTLIKRIDNLFAAVDMYQEQYTELARARELTSALYEASKIINFVFDIRVLLNLVMDLALKITRAERGFIMLYNEAKDELRPMVARNMGGEMSQETTDISRSIARRALEERKAIITENACADARFKEEASVVAYRVRSVIAVPMYTKDSTQLGVIYVDSPVGRPCFEENDSEFLSGFAGQASMALENARLLENIRREEQIRGNLQRFFSPNVVAKIMAEEGQVSLSGEHKTATILFCDIRGFTSLSEKMPTAVVVEVLNDFLSRMSEQVFMHDGTLDKYMGDCVMAVFGAPLSHKDDAARALRAALGMRWAVGELKEKLKRDKRFENVASIDLGIGINTGEVIAGYIGSEGRLEYTVIGDAVNLAARFEKLALAGHILVSKMTYDQVGDEFEVTKLPAVEVKGKSQPVEVYQVVGFKTGKGISDHEYTPPK